MTSRIIPDKRTPEKKETETVSIHIYSKSGFEEYSFPENFTASIGLEFNQGGLSGVFWKEKLK